MLCPNHVFLCFIESSSQNCRDCILLRIIHTLLQCRVQIIVAIIRCFHPERFPECYLKGIIQRPYFHAFQVFHVIHRPVGRQIPVFIAETAQQLQARLVIVRLESIKELALKELVILLITIKNTGNT